MPLLIGACPELIFTMTREMTNATFSTARSKNFNNGDNMKYKSLSDIDNEMMDLNEFNEPIQAATPKKHYLDQCPDISPQRFNELVLEALREFEAKQVKKRAS